MSLGALLIIVGIVLAVISIFVAAPVWLLAVATICIGTGVLVGAPPLVR